jgi:flavin reductase (DIM6/NTAB) family NADH-FMN oxidoreductase RutF
MAPVNPAGFRRAASRFASGIVVVSTRADGVDHAMTVTAFTAVSLEPVLVLFCAEKAARFYDAVLAAGTWAVSVLNEDAEKTARWLATRGRPLEGQLDAFRHHRGPLTAAPILDDALGGREVCERLAARGVLAKDTHGTTIRLAPPLVITGEDLDWALDQLEQAIR